MEKYIAGRGEEDNCTSAVSHQVENFISSRIPRAVVKDVDELRKISVLSKWRPNAKPKIFDKRYRTPRHLALSTLHVRLKEPRRRKVVNIYNSLDLLRHVFSQSLVEPWHRAVCVAVQ